MKDKAILSIFLLAIIAIASSSVMAVKDINVTPDSVSITGNSGDHFATFNVQNIGNETVNVSLGIINQLVGPGGATINMTNLNIVPATITPGSIGLGQFQVNLDNAVMGEYIGLINAQVENDAESASLVVTVNVTDNGQGFFVTSPPQNVTQSDATVYQIIKVQNNANHDISVQVAKQGYDGMTFNTDKIGSQTLTAFGTMDIVSSVVVPPSKPVGVYTAIVNVSDGAVAATANLGISVQSTTKASVSDLTISDVNPDESKSVSFNVENKGNTELTNLNIANFTVLDNDGDKLNVTFSPASINVSVGSSTAVTAKASVSEKMDYGTYSQGAVLSGNSISRTFTVNVEVNSILKVTDIDINPDNIMPGEDFEVDVTVENIANDIDAENVKVEIYIMDGNNVLKDEDNDKVEDDSRIGNLNNGDEEKVTFAFRAPLDAKDGDSYGVKVVVTGKNADDSSEKYMDEREDKDVIDVERPDHEVEIYKARLDSPALSCTKSTYIDVGLRDIGSNDEQVILTIKNDQLGLRVQDNFDMSSDYNDDNFEVERSYLLDFSSAPAGSYPVTVLAENEDDDRLGSETISVSVQECTATSTGTAGSETSAASGASSTGTAGTVDVVYSSGPDVLGATVPAVSAAPVSKARKGSSVLNSPLGMAMLVLGNLLLVILVIIALVYLVSGSGRKKSQF